MHTRRFASISFLLASALPAVALAGSQTYTSSGTFTAPVAGTVTIQVIGGGGGGGGGTWEDGYAGGRGGDGAATSISGSFGTISAAGGIGGTGQPTGYVFGGPGGAATAGAGGALVSKTITLQEGETFSISIGGGGGGGGAGGGGANVRTSGVCESAWDEGGTRFSQPYACDYALVPGYGPAGAAGSVGGAAAGGAGGIGGSSCVRTPTNGHSGPAQSGGAGGVSAGGGGGGGGAADDGNYGCATGETGGAGAPSQGGRGGRPFGYAHYNDQLAPGGATPGAGGSGGLYGGTAGGGGAPGSVIISWNVPAPSCSVTFDQNPLTGGSTVMRWSSANATLFYINNVGYVSASGSATVFSAGDYSGTVTGPGGTATCGGTLGGGTGQCADTTKTCGTDGNLHDSCGNTTACRYGCSKATNTCKNECISYGVCDAAGTRVIDSCTGKTLSDCASGGKSCVAGACVAAPVSFESFDADWNGSAFTASGHLEARPALLRAGQTARLYWNVKNAAACTISGTNSDSWTTLSSGASGKLSAPIMHSTVYTLHCNALSGATPAVVNESVQVNVAPIFQEQ